MSSVTPPPGPGGPEYLESSAGSPVERAGSRADRRNRFIALGGLVGLLAIGGGAVWAATSLLGTGAQPAEALPAGTLGYVSIDLDPSGNQKIEAISTLRKFPAFKDKINLDTDDDLRERVFEEVTKSGECDGLDYETDVKPWLGSRAAVAAVDAGEDQPSPVGVIQVTDAKKAEAGLVALVAACGGPEDRATGGWVVAGDWVVLAETKDIAQSVVDQTKKGSLADDDAFAKWTGEAGDDGIMSFYVSAEAADYAGELMAGPGLGMLGGAGAASLSGVAYSDSSNSSNSSDDVSEPTPSEVPEELQKMLDNFDGAAATVRFNDGALEIEFAMSDYQPELSKNFTSEAGVELLNGLPDDTVAAFALGFEPGWADAILDYVSSLAPDDMTVEEMIKEAESETGLDLPGDVETLVGEGVAVSVGEGIDQDAISNGGPGEVPAGVTIDGDPDEIQAVLDKLKESAGPELAPYLEVTDVDGHAVIGLNEDYRKHLASGGDLGGTETYEHVVAGDDPQSVVFINFNADHDWLSRLAEGEPEVSENLDPLAAFGASQWLDGDTMHGLLKLTTD